jgi:hypothetical protein
MARPDRKLLSVGILALAVWSLSEAHTAAAPRAVAAARLRAVPRVNRLPAGLRTAHVRHKAGATRLKIQVRYPFWRTSSVVDTASGVRLQRLLARSGWSSRMVSRNGASVLKYRMRHWHTAAVAYNLPVARQATALLQAEGFQTRVRR